MQKLVIVSSVIHHWYEGQLYAYGPYAREIDIWADLFAELLIAAPCRKTAPPGDCLPFNRSNISLAPVLETGGTTRVAKVKQVLLLPRLLFELHRTLRQAEAIHVRCPGNLGLLGALLAPLYSRRLVAKYAGQWNGYPREPWTVAFQRRILGSRWWSGPVTVYGNWPNQPEHVIPFFTSMMTSAQVERAVQALANRKIHQPLRVLYAGVLTPRKRVAALLQAVKMAIDDGAAIELAIVGGGSENQTLIQQAAQLGLANQVNFVGALPYEQVHAWYEWADCLVLPSQHSEGWPKVIAEAMCYGLICIAVEHGQVREMMHERGLLLKEGTPAEIAAALRQLVEHPERFEALRQAASSWSRRYSLEGLREALEDLLSEHWRVSLRHPLSADSYKEV